jgi:hypothetical protein
MSPVGPWLSCAGAGPNEPLPHDRIPFLGTACGIVIHEASLLCFAAKPWQSCLRHSCPPLQDVLTSHSTCRQEKNASFFASRCIFLRHGVTCCPRPVTRDAHKSLSPCCLRCVVSLRVPRPPAGKRRRKNEEARASIVRRWDADACPQLFSVFGPASSVFRICAAVRVPS